MRILSDNNHWWIVALAIIVITLLLLIAPATLKQRGEDKDRDFIGPDQLDKSTKAITIYHKGFNYERPTS
jgi:hypothetical protein